MFVGRDTETAQFMTLRTKRSASLVVYFGRRRVGKSTFIAQCASQFDHFFAFEGLPPRKGMTRADQLAHFATQLAAQTALPEVALDNWPQALQLAASAIPTDGWTVLKLDEVSWMALGDPDFPGHLKSAWDNHFKRHPKLVVVVCGSVSTWIEKNIVKNKGFVGRTSFALKLEPLSLPSCNAFWLGRRVAPADKLRLLAVTGGVPRYLEEIDPSESAAQNIHRLCFRKGALLVREFDEIFDDIFGRRAETHRNIVRALTNHARRTVSQISKTLRIGRGGTLSEALDELVQAGFIARDIAFDPETGNDRPRAIAYRLSDNYLRFYARHVAPKRGRIDKDLYVDTPLESILAFDTIMGLAFENLVLGSAPTVRHLLGLRQTPLNIGPYWQNQTQRRKKCQVDLLVSTKSSVYIAELELRSRIDRSVVGDVKKKVERLKLPRSISVRTALIYEGELAPAIEREDYFDKLIRFGDLLEG